MKCSFAVIVITCWLHLGASGPAFDREIVSVEEKFVDSMQENNVQEESEMPETTAVNRDFWAPQEDVETEGSVSVTGCPADATSFYNQYLTNMMNDLPTHFTALKLTCGACGSLVFEGDFKAEVSMCKSAKGTPCIKKLTMLTCSDPNPGNDLVFDFRVPIEGVSMQGQLNIIVTSDKKECFYMKNSANYPNC